MNRVNSRQLRSERSVVFSDSVLSTMVEADEETNESSFTQQQNSEPKSQPKFMIGGSDDGFEDTAEEEDEDVPVAVVPPDGGWGWVVVFASFMCNVMVDGIIFTTGMLFSGLREEFQATQFEVAWIASLLGGFYLLAGPFVSGLANAYGFRTVCIVGAVISSASCAASYFATSIFQLYITFGVIGGIGFGLIYVPAVIATGFYFEKKRALATGIAVCGSGIGTFIIAPINKYLLENYTWRQNMLVFSGLALSCSIYGLAFRPLSASTGKRRRQDEDYDDGLQPPRTPLLIRIKRARDEQWRQCASVLSMGSFNSRNNSKIMLEETPHPAVAFNEKGMHGNLSANRLSFERQGSDVGIGSKKGSYPAIVLTAADPIEEESDTMIDKKENDTKPTILDDNKNVTKKNILTPKSSVNKIKCPRIESAPVMASQPYRLSLDAGRRSSRISLKHESSRPFYRDDIFYSGSLARLPEYRSSDTVDKYHESVTNIPPLAVVNEEDGDAISDSGGRRCCGCCSPAVTNILSKMFDFSLFSSITFVILGVAGFMTLMALFVPFNFLPSFAKDLGVENDDASFLMSLIGICNTVGRIVCGFVSDRPNIDALHVNNFALMIGGAATMVLPFLTDLSLLYAYALVFGFSVAAFASLRSILLVELLGLEKLTNAFGLLLLCQGIAATFGSPIAGAFYDMTEDYNIGFYIFGFVYALSGIICLPLRKIKEWEDRRIAEKKLQNYA